MSHAVTPTQQVFPARTNVAGGPRGSLTTRREFTARASTAADRSPHDMERAREAQARLFPRKLPAMETLTYAGACIQARQVGGDYYDFLDLGRGYLGLAVADAVGKG